jgi:hypothetical protein
MNSSEGQWVFNEAKFSESGMELSKLGGKLADF